MNDGQPSYIVGLDFGSESARGILLDAATGAEVAIHIDAYAHGIMDACLPNGTPLPPAWSLQDAADYVASARTILTALGKGRRILSIGLDFTASSPLPVTAEGTPLSVLHPGAPHAYVKLYKHQAAQVHAEALSAAHAERFAHFGGRISGEWLIAKAAQMRAEALALWGETARFIEGGDWMVWQLTGHEARSYGFATYKAQYSPETGYPDDLVEGLVLADAGEEGEPLDDGYLDGSGNRRRRDDQIHIVGHAGHFGRLALKRVEGEPPRLHRLGDGGIDGRRGGDAGAAGEKNGLLFGHC